MKTLKRLCVAALPLALCGCLEVDQHPYWMNGKYAGKVDQRPYQVHFHNDRLAWWAAVQNRNLHQNEYIRAKPPRPAPAPVPLQPAVPDPTQAQVPQTQVPR